MTEKNYVQPILEALTEALPGCDENLLDLYALLALVKGTKTTLEDVHDAWSVWRALGNPTHKSLIPFDQLTPEVQELDRKYMNAIHAAAWTPRS